MSSQSLDGHGHSRPGRRQYVRFLFLRVDPAWRRLPDERRLESKLAVADIVAQFADRMLIRAYSTVGTRADADLLLWQVSPQLELFTRLQTELLDSPLGAYLSVAHSFLAMTKRSIYDIPTGMDSDTNRRLTVEPGEARYLFVYPFVKTRAWYLLPLDQRQKYMNDHIRIGRKYPSVKLNTTYSFGLDDQEFVVAFETDEPADFLDLVMELRESTASSYTERDVPILTCLAMSLPEVLDTLGGPRVAAVLDTPLVGSNGWLEVGPPDSVPEGGSRLVYYQGQQVAIFNVAGCFYAISNRCSHARGPLCEGTVHNTAGRPVVTCPWHGAQYALDTGRVLSGPAESPVSVFRTKLEGGRLWVSRQAAAFDEVLVANAEHRPER